MMSFTLHIDLPALYGDPGVTPSKISSEVSSLSLLARIWMWLSQIWGRETYIEAAESVFHLGPNDTLGGHRFQNLIPASLLGRRERRMLARYHRRGLSLSQVKGWTKARRKRLTFETGVPYYFSLAFFRNKARQLSRICSQGMGIAEPCKAPLSPD